MGNVASPDPEEPIGMQDVERSRGPLRSSGQWVYGVDVHAKYAYTAGMDKRLLQHTLRRVPPRVDAELRRRAAEERKSLNEVALQALERGLGLSDEPVRHHDMDDLAGTWIDDPEFDRALEEMDQVDPELWQ